MTTQTVAVDLGHEGRYGKKNKDGSCSFSFPVKCEFHNKGSDNMTITCVAEDRTLIASEKVNLEILRGDVTPEFHIPCHVPSKENQIKAKLFVKKNDEVIKTLPLTFRFQPGYVEIEAGEANQELDPSANIIKDKRFREMEEKINSLSVKVAGLEEKFERCHCNKPFPLQGKEEVFSDLGDGENVKAPVTNPPGVE